MVKRAKTDSFGEAKKHVNYIFKATSICRYTHILAKIMLILIITAAFFACKPKEQRVWKGETIKVFDNHKSDQNQMYPDQAAFLGKMVVIGDFGPMVEGVAIINDDEITQTVLKWNNMHNEKDLNLINAVYSDKIDLYGKSYSKTDIDSYFQSNFANRNPSYHQNIINISGKRIGDTEVQIDLMLYTLEKDIDSPEAIILVLERNRAGWRINKEERADASNPTRQTAVE